MSFSLFPFLRVSVCHALPERSCGFLDLEVGEELVCSELGGLGPSAPLRSRGLIRTRWIVERIIGPLEDDDVGGEELTSSGLLSLAHIERSSRRRLGRLGGGREEDSINVEILITATMRLISVTRENLVQ